jgi:hypothetical protein
MEVTMDLNTDKENEVHLLRSQLESLAKQQKRQQEVFEQISANLKDIRVAMVFMVIIFFLALALYVFRSGFFH